MMYRVLCKLEGLLLNNSLLTVLHNECFPMGKDLNHLMFCIVNFSRIWELARLEKPQPIIGFQHLFIIVKFLPPFFSVKVWLKCESIPSLSILSFRPQSSSENERTHSATVNPWKVIRNPIFRKYMNIFINLYWQ